MRNCLVLLLLGCSLWPACKSTAGFPTQQEWKLVELKNKPVPSNVQATLKFEVKQKRYGGKNSCNAYSGTYELDGSTLKFGPAITTKMYCADVADWEAAFMAMLGTVDNYSNKNQELRLFAGTKLVAVFH